MKIAENGKHDDEYLHRASKINQCPFLDGVIVCTMLARDAVPKTSSNVQDDLCPYVAFFISYINCGLINWCMAS